MTKKLPLFTLLVLVGIGTFLWRRTPPWQKIGQLPVGLLTREQVEAKLNSWIIGTKAELHLSSQTLTTTYANLNLSADYTKNPIQLKLNTPTIAIPLNPETNTTITYDPAIKQFVSLPKTYDEVLDPDDLLHQATAHLGDRAPVLTPTSYKREHIDNQVVALNAKLINAFSDGIIVKVKDGKEFTTVNLSPNQVLNLLSVTANPDDPQLAINSNKLANTVLSQLTPKQQADFQTPTAAQNTESLLNQRFNQATQKTSSKE